MFDRLPPRPSLAGMFYTGPNYRAAEPGPISDVRPEAYPSPEMKHEGVPEDVAEGLAAVSDTIDLDEARKRVADCFGGGSTPAPIQEKSDMEPTTLPIVAANGSDVSYRSAAHIDLRSRISRPESREAEPRFTVRPSTLHDIDDIVDIDLRSFDSVYSEYDVEDADLRTEMRQKFIDRFQKIGGEWMPVLIRNGKVVGFMACCPTAKEPDDFESWEKTTDNGTLETTYDASGKNIYVVTLSVLPEGSEAKDMLFMDQMGKMLREHYHVAFFESRLPGLRDWVESQAGSADALSREQLHPLVEEYYAKTVERKGKQVPYDRLLRLYDRVGCKLGKLAPDAYKDAPSLDYGVVCTFDGSALFNLEVRNHTLHLPDNKVTRYMVGAFMQKAAKSLRLTSKFF